MASAPIDILEAIQGGSRAQQERVAKAIERASSQSSLSEMYIPAVLADTGFRVEINLDDKPAVMAWYVGKENKIVFFLNHPQWGTNNDSQLLKVILHEFYHAFCTILHAPEHNPKDYPGDATVLSFPFMSKASATTRELREVQRYLQEGHARLSMVLHRYLMGVKEFAVKFPFLFQELKKCSENYQPHYVDNYYPKTKESCEKSYPKIFEQLDRRGVAQTNVYDTAFIIYKYIGATEGGECKFWGQDGHMDWPPELSQLFALYSEVYNLRNQWSDSTARRNYERFVPPEQIEFYLATEQVTHTMEIGCFMKFYDGLIKRLLRDIKENEVGMSNQLSEAAEELEETFLFSSNPEVGKEISAIMQYSAPIAASPEVIAQKIEEQQNALGLKLFMAISTVPQLMGAGLSFFLDAGEKMLAIAGSQPEASQENEANSSTAMYLAAGCTVALVGLGYYCFWRSGNAQKQAVENEVTSNPDLRKGEVSFKT